MASIVILTPPLRGRPSMKIGPIVALGVGVFVVTVALTVVIYYVRPSRAVEQELGKTMFAFPNAIPIVPPPVRDPALAACYQMCPTASGGLEPCASVAVRPCVTDEDCTPDMAGCEHAVCQTLTNWPGVANQQAVLSNTSKKFCLPRKHACFTSKPASAQQECIDSPGGTWAPSPDDTGGVCILRCTSAQDCVACTEDVSPQGQSFVCQYVNDGTRATTLDDKNVVLDHGAYCLPQVRQCKHGRAVWTAEGWTCKCDQGYGGTACDVLTACASNMATDGTKHMQKPVVDLGDGKYEDWEGSNKPQCVDALTGSPATCGAPGAKRQVFCMCDGVAKGTNQAFTYSSADPLQCVIDNCSANDYGGRYNGHTLQLLVTTTTTPGAFLSVGMLKLPVNMISDCFALLMQLQPNTPTNRAAAKMLTRWEVMDTTMRVWEPVNAETVVEPVPEAAAPAWKPATVLRGVMNTDGTRNAAPPLPQDMVSTADTQLQVVGGGVDEYEYAAVTFPLTNNFYWQPNFNKEVAAFAAPYIPKDDYSKKEEDVLWYSGLDKEYYMGTEAIEPRPLDYLVFGMRVSRTSVPGYYEFNYNRRNVVKANPALTPKLGSFWAPAYFVGAQNRFLVKHGSKMLTNYFLWRMAGFTQPGSGYGPVTDDVAKLFYTTPTSNVFYNPTGNTALALRFTGTPMLMMSVKDAEKFPKEERDWRFHRSELRNASLNLVARASLVPDDNRVFAVAAEADAAAGTILQLQPADAGITTAAYVFSGSPNTCQCSGAASNLWDFTGPAPVFKGRCLSEPIPGSSIVLQPETPVRTDCRGEANSAPGRTKLVPGKALFNGEMLDVCSSDPCTGTYSDPHYKSVERYEGTFDPVANKCACLGSAVSSTVANCDHTTNPVCSGCLNACFDDPLACTSYGSTPDVASTCPGGACPCTTDAKNVIKCQCPAGSVQYKNRCVLLQAPNSDCSKFEPGANVCAGAQVCTLVDMIKPGKDACPSTGKQLMCMDSSEKLVCHDGDNSAWEYCNIDNPLTPMQEFEWPLIKCAPAKPGVAMSSFMTQRICVGGAQQLFLSNTTCAGTGAQLSFRVALLLPEKPENAQPGDWVKYIYYDRIDNGLTTGVLLPLTAPAPGKGFTEKFSFYASPRAGFNLQEVRVRVAYPGLTMTLNDTQSQPEWAFYNSFNFSFFAAPADI